MPRIPEYEYQVSPRDAPDVQQSLKTSSSMFGGNQAKVLEAWGDAVGGAGDAIEGWMKPNKEKTAAEVLYPYMNSDRQETPNPTQRERASWSEQPKPRTAAETLYPDWAEKRPEPRHNSNPLWGGQGQMALGGNAGNDPLDGQFRGTVRSVKSQPTSGQQAPRIAGYAKDRAAPGPATLAAETKNAQNEVLPTSSRFPGTPVPQGADLPWSPQELPVNASPWPHVPDYKRDIFIGQPGAWHGFISAMYGALGPTDTEAFVLAETYAAEGGTMIDPLNGASSGITKEALSDRRKAGRIPGLDARPKQKDGSVSPKDLTLAQRSIFMRNYTEYALGRVGGYQALDRIGDPLIAATLFDTLYNHGESGGADVIRKALKAVDPDWTGMGTVRISPHEFEKFSATMSDPRQRRALLDAIAEERRRRPEKTDPARLEHFRWPGL